MAQYAYQPIPTVSPASGFNAMEDAATLRGAMKGFGTDEETIIDILTKRSNSQRQQISKVFTEEYGRDIIEDLKSELGGHFEDVIVGLMLPPADYLCKQMHKAMEGMGTDEHTLIEILCSKSNKEVKEIVEAYERLYDRPLAEHMCSETSGDFRRFLTLIVTGVRNDYAVDPGRAREAAEQLHEAVLTLYLQDTRDETRKATREYAVTKATQLHDAGELKVGTDEEVFNKIMAHESFPQLKLIFEEYKNVSGRTIEQALEEEISGELLEAMLALVECVQSPPAFFAKRLHNAMAGGGTDDITLIRIIVSRSEIDLGNVKQEYERLYDKTLESAITDETGGDYKRALLAVIGGP